MNLEVDTFKECATPKRYDPGIGLRPGGERHDIKSLVPIFFAALYESIAAHSRLGLNVVVDVGHHDAYAVPRGILADSARRLNGLPVLLVGVRCPIDIIMQRRKKHGVAEGSTVAWTCCDAMRKTCTSRNSADLSSWRWRPPFDCRISRCTTNHSRDQTNHSS